MVCYGTFQGLWKVIVRSRYSLLIAMRVGYVLASECSYSWQVLEQTYGCKLCIWQCTIRGEIWKKLKLLIDGFHLPRAGDTQLCCASGRSSSLEIKREDVCGINQCRIEEAGL